MTGYLLHLRFRDGGAAENKGWHFHPMFGLALLNSACDLPRVYEGSGRTVMDTTLSDADRDIGSLTVSGRPSEFTMPIQGGMLEALGINMYTTLGKCLVEFIANAYDGDSTKVEISIPGPTIS